MVLHSPESRQRRSARKMRIAVDILKLVLIVEHVFLSTCVKLSIFIKAPYLSLSSALLFTSSIVKNPVLFLAQKRMD